MIGFRDKRKEEANKQVKLMGSEHDCEPSPTPKLSLFSLPSKLDEPLQGMATPPLHALASVPFQWEEAPGRPRPCTDITQPIVKTARCLELPPRLLVEARVANMTSPTTVLEGPYHVGRSLSRSLSFRKGKSFSGSENLRGRLNTERAMFGSSRWESLRKSKDQFVDGSDHGMVSAAGKKVKITRLRSSRSSFMSFSPTGSDFLTSIFEGLKKVVTPWRRRQEKFRKNK